MWRCVDVEKWMCRVCRCGDVEIGDVDVDVEMCRCGDVEMCRCGVVEMWMCGAV